MSTAHGKVIYSKKVVENNYRDENSAKGNHYNYVSRSWYMHWDATAKNVINLFKDSQNKYYFVLGLTLSSSIQNDITCN